jgi:carbonic anhydrase
MTVTDELLQNNLRHAEAFSKGGLSAIPAKRVAVLACMDARMDVHKILGLEDGDAHVIRNAGGLPTDDAIRSLLISQRILGTEEIVLIHHTGCGMLDLPEEDVKDELQKETGARPPFDLGAFSDLEENLRLSLRQITANRFISRTSSVRGFIYDVSTGRLREIQAEEGPQA